MVALQARHGGVWKDAEPYVKRSGSWEQPEEVWAKENGVWVKVWPSIVARAFSISPAVSGKSTWDLDVDGQLNLVTAGTWTITPLATFLCTVEMWGGGGGGGGAGSTAGQGSSGGTSSLLSLVATGGGGGGNGVGTTPGPNGTGGTASNGDINESGEDGGRVNGVTSGYGGASPSGGGRVAGRTSVGNGADGGAPGGGGAGGYSGGLNQGGGGGGGARCKKDALSVSTQVTLTVGSGGAGGSAMRLGGTGADGKVVIS